MKKGDKVIAFSWSPFETYLEVGEFKPFGSARGYVILGTIPYKSLKGEEYTYQNTGGPYPLNWFTPYSETLFQQLKGRLAEVKEKQGVYRKAEKDLREFFAQAREKVNDQATSS